MKQKTFSDMAWDSKKKRTRREVFLSEMDAVIPWDRLIQLIEPYYPKGEGGRPPMPLPVMLRIYFMQQWFNLSDPQAEDGLYDSESMRRFAGLSLADDRIPDETTILNFRHLLEKHQLTQAIFNEVRSLLDERRLLLRSARSSMPRSLRRRPRPRTRIRPATRRCSRPARESSGISA